MCGRYTLSATVSDLQALLPGIDVSAAEGPRYNIAPSQDVAVVANDGRRTLASFRWGLIPPWAKEVSIGNRMINARSETLADKPSFRKPFRRQRCLVPADGFFEWRKEPDGTKTPIHIHRVDRKPFALAGLWESWRRPDGSALKSCTLITTQANELLAEVHARMPVILPAGAHAAWLSQEERPPSELAGLLVPCPSGDLAFHAVSNAVGNARNQGSELIEPC